MKAFWIKYRIYIISGIAAIWMLFLDSNNFLDLIQLKSEIADLKDKKAYYQSEIARAKKEREDLFSNQRSLETFAREKYLMKRDNEDIFVFRKADDKS